MVYSFSERVFRNSLTVPLHATQEPSAIAFTRDAPPRRVVRNASISGDLGVAFLLFFMRSIIHIRGSASRKFGVFLRLFWEPIPSGWPSFRSRTGSHDPRCRGAVNGGQVPLIVLISHLNAVVVSLLIRGPDGAVRIDSVHDHLTEVETEEAADFGGVVFLVFHTWIVP